MTIPTHQVVIVPSSGDPVDITCLCTQVEIHHGRDDADNQPEPPSATFDLELLNGVDEWPTLLEVGAYLRVYSATSTLNATRFYGRVTDMELGWDDAGEATPDHLVAKVMAAGLLADLGRRTVGDVPWPQEADGARVGRICAAAGMTITPTYLDPGTVTILARDVDSQPALELAQQIAQDARGVLWYWRWGNLAYADADHRHGSQVALALDSCDLLVSPAWKRTTEGIVNRVSLGYGPPPAEGEQPRYVATNATSQTRYGRYELSTETQLATLADATELGQLLLVRNGSPVWIMAALPVDTKGLDQDRTDALLSLDMHSLVNLTGLPSAGNAPTSAALWVEGWTERMAWGEWDITLAVSGYCRTSPPPTWDDLGGTGVSATNLAPNPGFESGGPAPAPGWGRFAVQITPTSGVSPSRGAYVGRVTTTATGSGDVYCYANDTSLGNPSGRFPAVEGDLGFWTVRVRPGTITAVRLGISWANSTPTTIRTDWSNWIDLAPGAWITLSVGSLAAPAGTAYVLPYLYWSDASHSPGQGVLPLGAYADVDSAMFTINDPLRGTRPYFDGDYADDAAYTYDWSGDNRASASRASAIRETWTWDTVDPADLTWDEAHCLGPPAYAGYWNDQPATLHWDQVAASKTWNTFK